MFKFIACSGYFKLSVYTWGIFLACIRGVFSSHIYVTDSRRDSISTYFGGVTRNTYEFPQELLDSRVSHLFPKEQ